jgi:tetratricopeptide (TPR) repeat protein
MLTDLIPFDGELGGAAYYNRACAYSQSGRYKSAIEDLREALAYSDANYRRRILSDDDLSDLWEATPLEMVGLLLSPPPKPEPGKERYLALGS